jgi:hypothetical protein
MGTTERELRRAAEAQRERMGDTLDAIGDRLSPERMLERRKAAVRFRWQRMRDSVMGSPGYEEPVTQRVRERASDAAHSAGDSVQSATDQVRRAPQMVADQARGNPVAAGVIAFGAGALLATLIPPSRTEQRLVSEAQPQLQHAADELKSVGRDVAEDAKEHARDAMDTVKSAGAEATQHVRDDAGDAADHVRRS